MTSLIRFAVAGFMVFSSSASAQIIGPREKRDQRVAEARRQVQEGPIYDALATSCGARFTGDQAAIAQRMIDRDDDDPTVDVAALLRRLDSLRNCYSVQRRGNYYVCKKGTQYEYYSQAGNKLNSQPCDEVFVKGSHASCMRASGQGARRTLEAIQSHSSGVYGSATCTSAPLLQPPPNRPGRSGSAPGRGGS
ncbi:MAG: hypothetical protein AAB250_15760 [Bdellovibrionota bacterium]